MRVFTFQPLPLSCSLLCPGLFGHQFQPPLLLGTYRYQALSQGAPLGLPGLFNHNSEMVGLLPRTDG